MRTAYHIRRPPDLAPAYRIRSGAGFAYSIVPPSNSDVPTLSETEHTKSQSPPKQYFPDGELQRSRVTMNCHSEEEPMNQDGIEVLLINLGRQLMGQLPSGVKIDPHNSPLVFPIIL